MTLTDAQVRFGWLGCCMDTDMKFLLVLSIIVGGALLYRMKMAGSEEDLRGRWTIVSAPEGWKKIPGMDVMVTAGEIQFRIGTVVTSKMHYTVDSDRRTIDAAHGDEAPRRGIYRLDGETLTLSVGAEGDERPDNPNSTENGAMRWVLKRAAHL